MGMDTMFFLSKTQVNNKIMCKNIIIIATILYVLFITYLSAVNISDKNVAITIPYIELVAHFCFYFVMNILLILISIVCRRAINLRWMLLATVLSIIYSIGIEIVQIYVGRGFEFVDIFANSIGAISAFILLRQRAVYRFVIRCIKIE